MTAQTIIITGANRGLGLSSATALAQQGHCIILAVRDIISGQAAKALIMTKMPAAKVEVLELDVTSMESITNFIKNLPSQIDILINNAGMYSKTANLIDFAGKKLEKVWITNYFGPAYLTMQLLPKLKGGKVVNVCSVVGHKQKLNPQSIFEASEIAYRQSKYANLLFVQIGKKFFSEITCVGAHPGFSATNIFSGRKTTWWQRITNKFIPLIAQSSDNGALPIITAAIEQNQSGDYYVPRGLLELWGKPKKLTDNPYYQLDDIKELWRLTERILDIS